MPKQFFLTFFSVFIFNSLQAATLEEAYQSALQRNESVGLQKAELLQVRERAKQMRGNLYPQLNANATYFVQPAIPNPIAQAVFPDKQTTIGIAANQALFRGMREYAGIRQANDLEQSQEQVRNQALVLLYQDVTTAYLNVLNLEQDLKNVDVQATLYGERVTELRGRVRRGESSSSEILTVQSSESVLRAEIQILEGNLKMARETFAFITGLPTSEPLVDPDLISKKTLAPLEDYLKTIDNRYDIKAAIKQFEAMQEEVKIAKGAHLPSLDLSANYYFRRPEGFMEDLDWDVQLRLVLPLFEGGITESRVREAAAKRMEADLTLARLRRQAEQEIRTYHQSYKARINQIEALQKAQSLSERNYKVLQKDYRRGLSRNMDVQLAMTDYRISSRSLDQARYAAQLELVRLQIASAEISAPQMKEE